MELIASNKAFKGLNNRYRHASRTLGCDMTLGVFVPPAALNGARVPVLYWLSGLTCTDENFIQKAGAQRLAAELGMLLVVPDTSPRGEGVADDPEGSYDLGLGAGFYVNATEQPWATHYRMYDYVVNELPELIAKQFPITGKSSIFGHSMGGHGALICALKNPVMYQSVSAFAPIANPSQCPWGEKAFSAYLGEDRSQWQQWDATELVAKGDSKLPILIDQGDADEFYRDGQLRPEALQAAAKQAGHPLTLHMRSGYDHSYFFIATFMEAHLRYHAKALA